MEVYTTSVDGLGEELMGEKNGKMHQSKSVEDFSQQKFALSSLN